MSTLPRTLCWFAALFFEVCGVQRESMLQQAISDGATAVERWSCSVQDVSRHRRAFARRALKASSPLPAAFFSPYAGVRWVGYKCTTQTCGARAQDMAMDRDTAAAQLLDGCSHILCLSEAILCDHVSPV